jgi:hypothetical protein
MHEWVIVAAAGVGMLLLGVMPAVSLPGGMRVNPNERRAAV